MTQSYFGSRRFVVLIDEEISQWYLKVVIVFALCGRSQFIRRVRDFVLEVAMNTGTQGNSKHNHCKKEFIYI